MWENFKVSIERCDWMNCLYFVSFFGAWKIFSFSILFCHNLAFSMYQKKLSLFYLFEWTWNESKGLSFLCNYRVRHASAVSCKMLPLVYSLLPTLEWYLLFPPEKWFLHYYEIFKINKWLWNCKRGLKNQAYNH